MSQGKISLAERKLIGIFALVAFVLLLAPAIVLSFSGPNPERPQVVTVGTPQMRSDQRPTQVKPRDAVGTSR